MTFSNKPHPGRLVLSQRFLEESMHHCALLWRFYRDNPGTTVHAAAEKLRPIVGHEVRTYNSLRAYARRMAKQGWLETASILGKSGEKTYYAKTGREDWEAPVPAETMQENSKLARARKRCTQLSQLAHEARYSALATTMGAALAKIEEDLRDMRDNMLTKRRS